MSEVKEKLRLLAKEKQRLRLELKKNNLKQSLADSYELFKLGHERDEIFRRRSEIELEELELLTEEL